MAGVSEFFLTMNPNFNVFLAGWGGGGARVNDFCFTKNPNKKKIFFWRVG